MAPTQLGPAPASAGTSDWSNEALVELAHSQGFSVRPCPETPAQTVEEAARKGDIFKVWTKLHNIG